MTDANNRHWSQSPGIKLMIIGGLTLALMIPAGLVSFLLYDRQSRQDHVVNEIASRWANPQTITGPVMLIPYSRPVVTDEGKQIQVQGHVTLLPESLQVNGRIQPEVRYRSIYETVVYTSELDLAGRFNLAELEKLHLDPSTVLHWDEARVALGISDLRGLTKPVAIDTGGQAYPLDPGTGNSGIVGSGASTIIKIDPRGNPLHGYTTHLSLRGSRQLLFAPVGKVTDVRLESPWDSPSFSGSFLPEKREVGAQGFTASWHVLHLNRAFPQAWVDKAYSPGKADFGVSLVIPANVYQQASRTIKYALMFIIFTFVAFFLAEIMNRLNVHPVQYLMVGLALVMFYSLEISLAEHLGFDAGYWIASAAVTLLVALYSAAVLGSRRMAVWIGGLLAILYGFLYLILQLEDYALLVGSIALFAALAALMYFTRRIDWYNPGGYAG